ncbi:MAG: hypothetical protein HKM02_07745 [Pseudomonadales bacterium]|nr:hypothetical protein [Pseudomonadales bacterium]
MNIHQFNQAVDLKFNFMLNQLFKKYGLNVDKDEDELMEQAYILGFTYHKSDAVGKVLESSPMLTEAYKYGIRESIEMQDDACQQFSYGTEDEWKLLSDDERDSEWEEFHVKCVRGIADDMYFYQVLMNKHMIGYVGH